VLAVTSALFSIRSIDIFCRRVVEALSELLGAAQEVAVCLQGGQRSRKRADFESQLEARGAWRKKSPIWR
jgi:hypothetical protein